MLKAALARRRAFPRFRIFRAWIFASLAGSGLLKIVRTRMSSLASGETLNVFNTLVACEGDLLGFCLGGGVSSSSSSRAASTPSMNLYTNLLWGAFQCLYRRRRWYGTSMGQVNVYSTKSSVNGPAFVHSHRRSSPCRATHWEWQTSLAGMSPSGGAYPSLDPQG